MTTPGSRRNLGRRVVPLVLIVLGMGALAWAAVPLYNIFCRVTGFAGTTQVATQGADRVLERTIMVRFDANTAHGLPWEFRPMQTHMTIHIGETATAFYEAYNPTDRTITVTTSYNVSPFSMGAYFSKIQCFCFTEQTLGPGERAEMPVVFFVDPEMVEDPDTKQVNTVTLSYTMYEAKPEKQAALSTPARATSDTR